MIWGYPQILGNLYINLFVDEWISMFSDAENRRLPSPLIWKFESQLIRLTVWTKFIEPVCLLQYLQWFYMHQNVIEYIYIHYIHSSLFPNNSYIATYQSCPVQCRSSHGFNLGFQKTTKSLSNCHNIPINHVKPASKVSGYPLVNILFFFCVGGGGGKSPFFGLNQLFLWAMFNSKLLVYQRVIMINIGWIWFS